MRLAKAPVSAASDLLELVLVDVWEDGGGLAQGLRIGTLFSLQTCVLSAGNIGMVSLSTLLDSRLERVEISDLVS